VRILRHRNKIRTASPFEHGRRAAVAESGIDAGVRGHFYAIFSGSTRGMLMDYDPMPIETSCIALSTEVAGLTERLAENSHDLWAQQHMKEGWRFGPLRDDAKKEHSCLVPHADLPESEKQYDRNSAMETLKAIIALGYRLTKT
jgi:ryanodine receptor 2